ncbi:hypothetical protein H7J87_29185 [Mycolicibacterium wolinskyi]|nr:MULTISPECIES: hypothetical protein [Mycolicibacterium]MCV7289409.1 hypothetical protein [Mycolicibacterium wolinskyi]MCV7297402.1 hypothetical protein [Mycolicibacterium goodii]
MVNLDRPRESTVRQLYALSMNQCAFPDCSTQLVTAETGTIIGEVCHIHAQNVGGPRYLASQTDEERHGFDNLILMCRNHHKVIDTTANLAIYTVKWLLDTKRAHEDKARESGEIAAPPDVITALLWTVTVYEAGATHMDFRNAVFKVGGEGGSLAGGGGSGGVLTIVGIASLPSDVEREMKIDLAGGNGEFPGSGGGGGGVLVFQGRPATAEDVDRGLAVRLLFPANSIALSVDGLLDLVGGGWEYYWVPEFPCRANIHVAFVVEFGTIEPNTLLGFNFTVTDQSGVECGQGSADVAVPEPKGMLNRRCAAAGFVFDAKNPGLYELTMHSAVTRFARYTFEVRLR